jgi:UDP-glucose 4-epimerase
MQKVLVTGGAGYIGSHTCVELIEAGFEVVVVDNLSNSSICSIDGIERITGVRPIFIKADCACAEEMEMVFKSHPDIVAVIHFAALKAVGDSVNKPLEYYRNNIVSLLNLLEQLKRNGGHLVFSSSCTVYGQPDILPVTEDSPIKKALSPYGNTKKIAEDIISDTVGSAAKMKAIALRYFNPIGAHPTGEIGEFPNGKPDNLVPFITQTAKGIWESLNIFGSDYNSEDGTAIRDYFHVVDLARAHIVSLKRMLEGNNKKPYEVFNLGAGNGVTVLQIVKSFERATGVRVNYKLVSRRPGDIEKVWADTTLAKKELGWSTQYTLEEALLSAWKWEQRDM